MVANWSTGAERPGVLFLLIPPRRAVAEPSRIKALRGARASPGNETVTSGRRPVPAWLDVAARRLAKGARACMNKY
jgi:hypothetical protein